MKAMKFLITCAVLLVGAVSGDVSAPKDLLSQANLLPQSSEQMIQDFWDII